MKRDVLVRKAQRVVEKRRQDAEMLARERKTDMYIALPFLRELDGRIAELGVLAVRLAADGRRREADEKLEEQKRLKSEKKEVLAKAGITPEELQPQYNCSVCNDTGHNEGLLCECVHKEIRKMRRQEVNESGPLTLCQFENFSLKYYPEQMEENGILVRPRANMTRILDDCKTWAKEFGLRSPSLYMFGNAGLGKTHLALSIASKVLDAGRDVIYVSAQRAFATVAQNEDDGELFSSMLHADLLVLDDLGTEYLNAVVRSRLYDLVNTRMGRRPTIYTSNICSQELLEQRYDEKISSRLLGDCHPIRFWGEDIRLQKYQ